jgi:hypothetical protein
VTELTAGHVAVDRLAIELEAGREPFDDAGQARSVGLAGGDDAQAHGTRQSMPRPGERYSAPVGAGWASAVARSASHALAGMTFRMPWSAS